MTITVVGLLLVPILWGSFVAFRPDPLVLAVGVLALVVGGVSV